MMGPQLPKAPEKKYNKETFFKSKEGGLKDLNSKPRTELFPMKAFIEVSKIITYGANKYAPDNWRDLEIYWFVGALLRHMAAYMIGERIDPESGRPHTSHMACNANFICELDAEGKKFDIPTDK